MAKAELRKRNRGRGDYPVGSPLADAVDRFRELARLHLNSPDIALVHFAHGDGRERPGAARVRDTVAALQTRGAERTQEPLVHEGGSGGREEPVDGHLPLLSDQLPPIPAVNPAADAPSEELDPGLPPLRCPHNCQSQDSDFQVICLDCGEVLFEPKPLIQETIILSPLFADVPKHVEFPSKHVDFLPKPIDNEIEDDEVLY